MIEFDPRSVSVELGLGKPLKLKQTIEASRNVLTGLGVTSDAQVTFMPAFMIEELDRINDGKESGMINTYKKYGISVEHVVSVGGVAAISKSPKDFCFSTEDFGVAFLERINVDPDITSFASLILFAGFARMSVEESATEVDISSDKRVIEFYLDRAFQEMEEKSQKMSDPQKFLDITKQIKNEIEEEGDIRVVGKGAQLILKQGELIFDQRNSLGNARLVSFFVQQGMQEFTKYMRRKHSWFIPIDQLSDHFKEYYYRSEILAPEDIKGDFPGYSFRKLVQDYLNGQIARKIFKNDTEDKFIGLAEYFSSGKPEMNQQEEDSVESATQIDNLYDEQDDEYEPGFQRITTKKAKRRER